MSTATRLGGAPVALVCSGCGHRAPSGEPYPYRCPNASSGDGADHVMTRVVDPSLLRFPEEPPSEGRNPFLAFRRLFYSYHQARSHGLSDEEYVGLAERLDRAVAGVDGKGFSITPLSRSDALGSRLGFAAEGGVWIKDETGNVSGSHKARHLMGLLLQIEVAEQSGLVGEDERSRDLAIASCGNAALAAAVVARAGGRTLDVFIPTSADPGVVERLRRLGARLNVCPRREGVPGDPTYHRLRQALAAGALPFTCQGNENGLTIEGGLTLGYEIAAQMRASGCRMDRLFVQVGGGALASSCIQGLQDAVRLGALRAMPRVHAVQTRGGFPLKRAYDLVAARILERLAGEGIRPRGDGYREAADAMLEHAASPAVAEVLDYAAAHRSEFMWPWEEEPSSIAHGILDDETYDWVAVVRGMVTTGGYPVLASEETLVEANEQARADTGIDVDHTGSSGFAGLVELARQGGVAPGENVVVLFTGIRR